MFSGFSYQPVPECALVPEYRLNNLRTIPKSWNGNHTGERGALTDRRMNSLRVIWPI
jgi:hypothetical protein